MTTVFLGFVVDIDLLFMVPFLLSLFISNWIGNNYGNAHKK